MLQNVDVVVFVDVVFVVVVVVDVVAVVVVVVVFVDDVVVFVVVVVVVFVVVVVVVVICGWLIFFFFCGWSDFICLNFLLEVLCQFSLDIFIFDCLSHKSRWLKVQLKQSF